MWNTRQIKEFGDQIRKSPAGSAWAYLVPDIRHAVVDAKVLAILRGQDRESIPMAAIDDLYTLLHAEMGTDD